MGIDFYYVPGMTACQSVRVVAEAVGVNLNLKQSDGKNKQNFEIMKMSPIKTPPILDDNGFHLWQSRAICIYLIEMYAKDDALYPKGDPKVRALINQLLDFNQGVLYNSYEQYFMPIVYECGPADETKLGEMHEALKCLEKFVVGRNYLVGDKLTVADLILAVTVSNIELCQIDFGRYPKVKKWLDRIKREAPRFKEINLENIKFLEEIKDKCWKNFIKLLGEH